MPNPLSPSAFLLHERVRQAGAAANLTGATAYLVWTHRQTGKRGTTEFESVDASAGAFKVFYPAAMCEAAGIVDASVMLSLGDGRYIATRGFLIRVEKVLVDGLEPEDGFTLFVQAIAAYENAAGIFTEAAQAANHAAADVLAAMQRGDFDGADGQDGFSPTATVTQTAGGATITITDKNGTTFTPVSPLALSNGELSVDLSDYAEASDIPPTLWVTYFVPTVTEYSSATKSLSKSNYPGLKPGDFMWNPVADTLVKVYNVSESGSSYNIAYQGMVDLSKARGILATTDIDLAPGVAGAANVDVNGHSVNAGTLLLNTTSGNLMRATAKATPSNGTGVKVGVSAVGIANVFNANVTPGTTYTAASPLSIDANDEISIDLSGYAALAGATFTGAVSGIAPTANAHFATKQYVDGAIPSLSGYATETWVTQQINAAIAALDDLSEESF